MLPAWAAQYVGLPFLANGRTRAGLDCYGLVRLVLLEQFAVELPRYDGAHVGPHWPGVAEAVRRGLADWQPVSRAAARVGDGLVLRLRGYPLHVGLVIDAAPLTMLHVVQGTATCCQRLDSPQWQPRLLGVYRWEPRHA
jgi:cell wall-associated NlpC family hydrolase